MWGKERGKGGYKSIEGRYHLLQFCMNDYSLYSIFTDPGVCVLRSGENLVTLDLLWEPSLYFQVDLSYLKALGKS